MPPAARGARTWSRTGAAYTRHCRSGHSSSSSSSAPGTTEWQQQQQEVWKSTLQVAAGKHGSVQDVFMLPYKSSSGKAGAIIRYKEPDSCRAAAAALNNTAKLSSCMEALQAQLQYCMTLPVDGRTLRAVRPRLEKAVARARELLPGVLVSLLERPVTGTLNAAASNSSKDSAGCGAGRQRSSTSSVAASKVADDGSSTAVQLPPPATEGLVWITGSQQQDVTAARGMLEQALAGRVFEGAGHEDLAVLLTPAGKAFLLGLEVEHSRLQSTPGRAASAVHIRWERHLNRLRLYGPDHKLDLLEGAIASKLQHLKEMQIKHSITLPAPVYKHLLHNKAELAELQQQSGVTSVGLDVAAKGLQVAGTAAAVAAVQASALALLAKCGPRNPTSDGNSSGLQASSEGTPPAGLGTTPPTSTCTHHQAVELAAGSDRGAVAPLEGPVCRCDVDQPYSLAGCRHTYCHSCLEALLSSATRNDFPVSCCADGCSSSSSLADLGHLLPAAQLFSAFTAAFRAFVQDRHEEWGCCLSPDCPQVYRKGVLQFQCDCCLATWCTSCLVPFHDGQTCQQYQDWKRAAAHGDEEFEAWKRSHTKPCPKCKAPIEKNEGCNHMTCRQCKAHFCWLCGKEFADSGKTYDHLVAAHGGIFHYR